MITQNGYQGSRTSVIGSTEYENYLYGRGIYPSELAPYFSRMISIRRNEELGLGGVAMWPAALAGIGAATQPTAGNQPTVVSSNINSSRSISFTKASSQYVAEPSSCYTQLSGPNTLASHTVMARLRVLDWANSEIYGITTSAVPDVYNHRMTVDGGGGQIAFVTQSVTEQVSSETTDYTETDRYVAFVTDAVNLQTAIVERGKRVSAQMFVNPNPQTVVSAHIGAINGLLPFGGQIDEIIVIKAALSDTEITNLLPYVFRDHYCQFLWFGNSLLAAGAFLASVRDRMPRGVGTVAGWQRGGITTANLLAVMRTRLSGQVIPGVTRCAFWEATNSIFYGATYDMLVRDHLQVRQLCDAAGVELLIPTVLPRASFNATQNLIRTKWNNELKNNWSSYVTRPNYVVKFDEDVRLSNPNDLAVYSDGTHWTALGASYGAEDFYNAVIGGLI